MKTFKNSVKVNKIHKASKIEVEIRLDDCCGNGICSFAITADTYRKARNGRWVHECGGCCHDEILKEFPEFADFVALHLSNVHGQPSYAVENGHYFLAKYGAKRCAEYLRIDEQTAQMLSGDKEYFKYQLFALGIVEQWEQEAQRAIKHFEELKCAEWVNPYSEAEERFVLTLSDEEHNKVEELIKSGYYTPAAIAEREARQKEEKRAEMRFNLISGYDNKIAKIEQEKNIFLCVFNILGSTDNIIYYEHSNTLTFNWQNYGKIWTAEDYAEFVKRVDMALLPDGIKFVLKSNN